MSEAKDPEAFTGGRKLMLASAIVGAVGTALTAVGFALKPQLAATSWLLAFTYWSGLAMASLLIVAIFNASLRDAVTFFLLIVILAWRPLGLFEKPSMEKV